jgi:hypothetical protein
MFHDTESRYVSFHDMFHVCFTICFTICLFTICLFISFVVKGVITNVRVNQWATFAVAGNCCGWRGCWL